MRVFGGGQLRCAAIAIANDCCEIMGEIRHRAWLANRVQGVLCEKSLSHSAARCLRRSRDLDAIIVLRSREIPHGTIVI